MKCPSCQADNKEEARFCRKCGSKLLKICPQCGSENLPDDNFCDMCGHNISAPAAPPPKELSFEEKIAKIQRYLPKGVTEKILSQRDKIEGERKQVTVMFCDMEGFTALSERVGPEEAYSIMDEVYEILIHKVHDYEGTVNEMTGDGIMALFGAPIALEDASQRAIRSAYAIHREMARLSDRLKQERGIPSIRMRAGIHTGPVVVGTLGNDLRVEFKAVGDTVNLASRMEEIAEPGATYVTEDTFKHTEGLFVFEALGERRIKGKQEPVKAYRVIGPSGRRTRFDVSAERGLTPFVGRERELELLLDGFERAKESRGQAVSVMAEAGVGKSRLLYEFRKAVANEDVTFLEGKCLSYSRGVAYHPVIDILKSNFDVHESDGDSEIGEKVRRGLQVLGADEASTLPYLLELLSVKDSGIDKIPMSPEARKDRIIRALKRIVLLGSEIRPLIMAIEDLHWIDKSSEDSLKDLLDSISGARIFLVFTYRPDFVQTWGGKSYHSQMTLNRLSNRESLLMVLHLLGTEELDQDVENLILDKTEGVPFFIEEFVKSLEALRIIEKWNSKYHLAKEIQDVTIPSTIQDVIMARVDSLPEDAKELLQTGSVIEREFSYELIKWVSDLPEQELLSSLSVLKDLELLYERGIYPQSTYVFKHALTQEVVYDSVLTKRKKSHHEKIGNAIEELYKDNLEEHYGVLAEHYIASESYEKGAEYCRLAGRRAEKTASLNDAISYTKKRVTSLGRLAQTDDVEMTLIDARTTLGLYLNQISDYVASKEAIDPIVDLASKRGYKRRLLQIYTIIGAYNYSVEEDVLKALASLEKAVSLSEEVKDVVSLLFANMWLGATLAFNCEFQKAIPYIQKAVDINVAANSLWGISTQKSILSSVYLYHGKVNLGYETSDQALQIAGESGDIYSKAMAHTVHGWSNFCKGFVDEAQSNCLIGAELCEKIGYFMFIALAHYLLGEIYFALKKYQKSISHYDRAIWILEEKRFLPSNVKLYETALARAKVMNNDKDVDLRYLYRTASENKLKIYEGSMCRNVGAVLLNVADHFLPEAEEWMNKAIKSDTRNNMIWELGRDYALYADLFKRKGDLPKAKENLGKAIEILKECGADGWVEKYEKELAEISR